MQCQLCLRHGTANVAELSPVFSKESKQYKWNVVQKSNVGRCMLLILSVYNSVAIEKLACHLNCFIFS